MAALKRIAEARNLPFHVSLDIFDSHQSSQGIIDELVERHFFPFDKFLVKLAITKPHYYSIISATISFPTGYLLPYGIFYSVIWYVLQRYTDIGA